MATQQSLNLEKISQELSIEPDILLKEGVYFYLEKEMKLAEEDIKIISDRYHTNTPEQLGKQIKRKKIPSHPAWEDLIQWENLLEYIKKIKKLMKGLKRGFYGYKR